MNASFKSFAFGLTLSVVLTRDQRSDLRPGLAGVSTDRQSAEDASGGLRGDRRGDPLFLPNVPDLATLAALSMQQAATDTRSTYQVDPHLRVPSVFQVAAGIERQLPHGLSVAANYTGMRGDHGLLTRDIDPPRRCPAAANAASGPAVPAGGGIGVGNRWSGCGANGRSESTGAVHGDTWPANNRRDSS